MSGALKHVFDSCFLAIGGSLEDNTISGGGREPATQPKKPYGLFLHGRYDTEGATRSVTSIAGALNWEQVFKALEVLGAVDDSVLERGYELGATVAVGLTEG